MKALARLVSTLTGLVVSVAAAAVPADVIDFSTAGYRGGGVSLPLVPAVYAVAPSGGDDTTTIQAALDAAAGLPERADGFRGAVVLRPGRYQVGGQLRLSTSGVVLRGLRATLVATGESRRTLIQVGGDADRTLGTAIRFSEDAPAGAKLVKVEKTDGLAVGARIVIRRPSTREWIAALGMTDFPGPGQYKEARLDWVPGSRDIEWERTITAVDANARAITLDAPLTTAIEARFGGGVVQTQVWPGRVHQVGVENIECISETAASNPLDEEHSWIGVGVDRAEDVWVRNVVARRFVCAAVWVGNRARAVTVQDCVQAEPVAEHAAWRRVGFYVGGQQVLVQRCLSENGRHDFAAGHCSAGPNVFLDCQVNGAEVDAGPFESWASGVLYDNVTVAGAGLCLANIGSRTQGAGWTAAFAVAWNCSTSGKIWVDYPPNVANRVYADPGIRSLYRAQLEARSGAAAVAALAGGAELVAAEAARDAAAPAGPAPKAVAAKPVHPLSVENGYFVVDGRVLFGGSMNSALWKGQLIPGREREGGSSPTRWAPGRVGPGLTEDLDALTNAMAAQQVGFYWAYPGLWYDRRRDDHSIAIREDAEVWGPFAEPPWRLSGVGRNAMGLSKYDLTKFNPWYFSRLRELADRCGEKGLIFACQVYDNHNVQEAAAHWADFAWRPLNSIQDVGFPEPPNWENAGQNRHHIADAFYDPTHPVRRRLHERYVRHTLDVLGDAPNVVFTVGYQFAGPLPFQEFFLDTIAAWQAEHGRRVHIALQTSKAVTDAILADPARAALVDVIDLRYWQYLADGKLFAPDGKGKLAFRELRSEAFGRDAMMRTTAELVYRQVREYRDRFPDKAIIAGHGGFGPIPVLMAGGAAAVVAESTPGHDGPSHDDQAFLRFVKTRLADRLAGMKPVDGVAANAWCLSDATRSLLYSLGGDAIMLEREIRAKRGTWFNPRTGETSAFAIAAGLRSIAKPTSESWLLLIE